MDKDKCKYHSYETFPARLFFEVKKNGNYQLMRAKNKVNDADLKAIFWQVYNDWFIKLENQDAEEYVRLTTTVECYELLIPYFKNVLEILWEYPKEVYETKEGLEVWRSLVVAVNANLDVQIDIDGILVDEFDKALNVSIGIMENEMNEAKIALTGMQSKVAGGKEFDFYDELQSVNEWNAPQSTSSECLLPEYVAAVKSAYKKGERQRLKQMTDGK